MKNGLTCCRDDLHVLGMVLHGSGLVLPGSVSVSNCSGMVSHGLGMVCRGSGIVLHDALKVSHSSGMVWAHNCRAQNRANPLRDCREGFRGSLGRTPAAGMNSHVAGIFFLVSGMDFHAPEMVYRVLGWFSMFWGGAFPCCGDDLRCFSDGF